MKKISLLVLVLVFAIISCKKENDEIDDTPKQITINKEQVGFILEYTATWCGPCGNWGAPTMHEIVNAGNVVGITVHASGDPMYNQGLYNSFDSGREVGGGIPSFWIGDVKGYNTQTMTSLLAETPEAAIGMEKSIEGNIMTVKLRTEFYEAGLGDYYLSVLVLESGIDGSSSAGEYDQNGTSDIDYKHNFVLRATATESNVWGEHIGSNPPVGASIEKEYTIQLDASWTNEVYPVAILWKRPEGNTFYEYINAVK